MASKKVPALSLIFVGIVGMVAGVIAASIIVTSTTYVNEFGTYQNNTGTMTVTDNGLNVVANAASSNITTSTTFGASGNNKVLNNALTAGNWMNTIVFTGIGGDSATHTATITIKSGTGPAGSTTLINAQAVTLVGGGAGATGTITVYLDLGTTSITAPMTVYIKVT